MNASPRLVADLTLVVAGGLLGAIGARALKLPVIVGYLIAGVALGPSGFKVLRDSEVIGVMAEVGVALLMFAIGVELSLGWLSRLKRAAFVSAPVQIVLTGLLGYAAGVLMGWRPAEAVILGFALSLSSTMVVIKILSERGELHTRHGQAMVAILIIQDLAVVLMVAIIPVLSGLSGGSAADFVQVAAKGVAFLLWIFALARWIVPAFMRVVARSYSKEVFVATAAALCLGGAASGHVLGFSLALGAFAAGLVISESPYGHELLSNVTPLRDLFGMIFFVSLGLLFDVSHVGRSIGPVVVLLIGVFVGKAIITTMAALAGRYHARAAIAAGLGLAQIGEFSFLVATLAWRQGVIRDNVHSLIIAVATLSLLATPFWMHLGHALYLKMRSHGLQDDLEERAARRREPLEWLKDHVVLCGYGRIGSRVGEALLEQGHPFLVVDYDQHVINALASRGVMTIYGDASISALLSAAGAARARVAVVALPEGVSTRLAVRELRRLNPSLPIVARAHSDEEVDAARREGATRVVYAELEAGLEMMRDALLCLGRGQGEVQDMVDRARSTRLACPTENGGGE